MDWDDVLDALVSILNLPAVDGGLQSVDANFLAFKDEPDNLAAYPRAFCWLAQGDMFDRSVPGGMTEGADEAATATIAVGIAVASAATSRSIVGPKARRFLFPLFDLLDLHEGLSLPDVVSLPRRGWEIASFGGQGQAYAGLVVYLPTRINRTRAWGLA